MNNQLSSKLTRIADILQADGRADSLNIVEQVCNLIYLKIIDEEESDREIAAEKLVQNEQLEDEILFVGQTKRYRWSEWREQAGQRNARICWTKCSSFYGIFSQEAPQIADYFRDVRLKMMTRTFSNRL